MGNAKVSKCSVKISKLVVGLGNPDWFYQHTRHNVGKQFIDYVIQSNGLISEKIKGGEIAYLPQKSGDGHIAFFKTSSFMNISGSPVKSAFEFCEKLLCKLDSIKNLIVVIDDLEQAFGKFRIKEGGSAKGHNGVKSTIDAFDDSKDFKRVMIGIGRPESRESRVVAKYVTSNFEDDQLKQLEDEIFQKVLDPLNTSENLDL